MSRFPDPEFRIFVISLRDPTLTSFAWGHFVLQPTEQESKPQTQSMKNPDCKPGFSEQLAEGGMEHCATYRLDYRYSQTYTRAGDERFA